MSYHPLKNPLEDLHRELADATEAEPDHPRLRELQSSTQSALAQLHTQPTPESYHDYRSELKEAVAHFEASHPKLTLSVISVITALNRVGI
jgi:hypothetical protein